MPTDLRSILSAVDFSEQSRQALRWAGALAARFKSRLTVVSVVHPLLAEAAQIQLHQDLARDHTEPALREFVATTWPGETIPVRPAFTTAVGDAATVILQTAAAVQADLIVAGTHGLGGLRKWLLGSTTERLLRRTHVPVLAVPLADDRQAVPASAGAVARILAATDFSESSVAAAKVAAELARRFSATLTLAHIVERLIVPPHLRDVVDAADEARIATAETNIQALAEQICGPERCDDVVVVGRPAELIALIAQDRRAHLIVMGLASDRGPLSPRPGSIAYRVLGSTAIPVLVVPAAQT
jgi:nucleotide-binding universal stress UspA family protein